MGSNERNKLPNPYARKPLLMSRLPFSLVVLMILLSVLVVLLVMLLPPNKTKATCSSNVDNTCPGKVLVEHHYSLIKERDIDGHDLIHIQTNDLATLKRVCDLFDECRGFNSNGWLKTSVSSYQHGPADLYVRQEPLGPGKSNQPSNVQTEYRSFISNMKIYVYDMAIGLEHHPRRIGGYETERVFVEQLLKSAFVTQNPNEATFFFIPIRCSSYILDYSTEHEGVIEAKKILGQILSEIKQNHPYWSWSGGSDHFYICAHDIGAKVGSDVLKNAIALVNTADYEDPYFIPHKDISLPPSVSPGLHRLARITQGGASVDPVTRTVFAFFAGDLKSGRIRPTVWNEWSMDEDFVIKTSQLKPNTYMEYLRKSKFCLVVRGREVWSPRLVESLFAGCVPVILSNHYHLPLQGIVDWNQFSIIVPENEVADLKQILHRVTSQQLLEMQAKITSVYQHFVWNNPAQPSDAFYSVMQELWTRRNVVRYKSKSPQAKTRQNLQGGLH
uniref:Probable glycosyltransferase At5g11130 n=1 Tax=Phallusia mammillata TaxID=59560 RepID=A0A6F9DBP9_9ASCI|nr:probable glycosyltransferase At5g11130 [Phallusia mammillata]